MPKLETVEDVLEHYGVKGMKWGVRKQRTPQQELARARQQMDKIDANQILSGYELRGWALRKAAKKATRKDPKYKYSKLTPEQRQAVQLRAAKKVKRSSLIRGTAEVAVILGGGALFLSKTKLSPQSKQGAAVSVALLAGQVGRQRLSEIHAVNTSLKADELRTQIQSLEKGRKK